MLLVFAYYVVANPQRPSRLALSKIKKQRIGADEPLAVGDIYT